MIRTIFAILLLSCLSAQAQRVLQVDQKGNNLKTFYLSLKVESLWLAGSHIDWQTGLPNKPDATTNKHTHCSAFVAATCKKVNMYILRPPDHGQQLLANAQFNWLSTSEAADAGWRLITRGNFYDSAQSMANRGMVVIAICKNPDEKKPGHAALVMPMEISSDELDQQGPEVIMAGTHNYNAVSLKVGFRSHLKEWPEHEVLFYYNASFPRLGLEKY